MFCNHFFYLSLILEHYFGFTWPRPSRNEMVIIMLKPLQHLCLIVELTWTLARRSFGEVWRQWRKETSSAHPPRSRTNSRFRPSKNLSFCFFSGNYFLKQYFLYESGTLEIGLCIMYNLAAWCYKYLFAWYWHPISSSSASYFLLVHLHHPKSSSLLVP